MKARMTMPYPAADFVPDDAITLVDGIRYLTTGYVFEHPQAWKLVHGGIAEPVDDECAERAKRGNPKTAGWMAGAPVRIMQEFRDHKAEKEVEDTESESMDTL